MASSTPACTAGSSAQSPLELFDNPDRLRHSISHLSTDDLRQAVITAFSLAKEDSYIYHATASVSLSQVQTAIEARSANGLHSWYLDFKGQPLGSPSSADIEAYVAVFNPKNSTTNTLKSLGSNARKGSIRSQVAEHLTEKRQLDERFILTKRKKPPANPYLDFWAWSCKSLEWCGPTKDTTNIRMSHHVLPVFMHHFGCVVPSFEAVEVIRQVAERRTVYDVGSGNGYWTLMLRRAGLEVIAVDNKQSEYRTMWISDTTTTDGARWLKSIKGGVEGVLLLVYPVTESDFTSKVLAAYRGDTVCVAGTQNQNGYTSFKNIGIEEYMSAKHHEFQKTVQIPLPSFAGKDEALFVFEKNKN